MFERTLRILVYNIDVNRKHRIVGVSHLELKDVDLSQGKLVRNFIFKFVKIGLILWNIINVSKLCIK